MPYAPRHLPTEGTANTSNWEQLVAFRFGGTALEGGLGEPAFAAWSNPGAQVARAVNKEFEVSATKNALVLLQLNAKAAEVQTNCSLKSAGIQVGTVNFPKAAEEAIETVTIPVPAGKKWEVSVTAGALSALNSSYQLVG